MRRRRKHRERWDRSDDGVKSNFETTNAPPPSPAWLNAPAAVTQLAPNLAPHVAQAERSPSNSSESANFGTQNRGIHRQGNTRSNGHSVDDDHHRSSEVYGRGLLTAAAIDVQAKMDKADARERLPALVREDLREAGIGKTPDKTDVNHDPLMLIARHVVRFGGNACRKPGTRTLISPPHQARCDAAAQRWAHTA